jgi:hypothetical protein
MLQKGVFLLSLDIDTRDSMNWTPQLRDFIQDHISDAPERLLLSAHRYPEVDVVAAVDQIAARQQLRQKLPEWYAQPDLMMSGRVPAEQCSSELTARYKRELVLGETLADLTGGMGVDLFYMSQGLRAAEYFERQPALCVAACHNFAVLGAHHITVHEGDGCAAIPTVDTIYLDPARRSADGGRVYDLTECEPDVVALRSALLTHCRRLVVKISPMADLTRVLQLMPGTIQLHILAVRGECKEVLLVLDAARGRSDENMTAEQMADVQVFCVDYRTTDILRYSYRWGDEATAQSRFAEAIGAYLYEPDVTLLKAGAFRSLCSRYGLRKLEVNSHLYTGDTLERDFPGRLFAVDEVLPFASRTLKKLKGNIPQANITTRNFPLTADQLRARTGIRDGGAIYLFGTMLQGVGALLLRCHKALLLCLCWMALSLLSPSSPWLSTVQARNAEPQTVESLLRGVALPPMTQWQQGRPFVMLNERLPLMLQPEQPVAIDTTDYRGTLWTFDRIVAEENWLGQASVYLRFVAPDGRPFRYDAGLSPEVLNDTCYVPHLEGLCDYILLGTVDSLLRARTLYILTRDERITLHGADDRPVEQYRTVCIDSVTVGTDSAPLRVWFSQGERCASVDTALPESREARMTTPMHKIFSFTDPRDRYPNITDDAWDAICRGELRRGMSQEEVRLALGRPERFERNVTRRGLWERWFYRSGRTVEFWDGVIN